MMILLQPTYTLRVTIRDVDKTATQTTDKGHQFYGRSNDLTGCNTVLAAVALALKEARIENVNVHLEKFEHS